MQDLQTTYVKHAEVLGKQAFLNGIDRVPLRDAKLWKIIESAHSNHKIPVLKAWLSGWDALNLIDHIGE